MVNPQAENGHIDVANEIAEQFEKLHLSGNEWQVLWVVLRNTWGWHKKEDAISLTQFQKFTNLSRMSVSRSIQVLVTKKILLVTKSLLGANVYSLNKVYTDWGSNETVTSKGVVTKMILGSNKTGKKVVTKSLPTKETIQKKYTKEINTHIEKNSKNSHTPCTEDELLKIADDLKVSVDSVELVHGTILDKIAAGELDTRKHKTVYFTLRQWTRMGIERGTIKQKKPYVDSSLTEEDKRVLYTPYPGEVISEGSKQYEWLRRNKKNGNIIS